MQITEEGRSHTNVAVNKRRFLAFTDAWLNSNGNLLHFQYDPTNTGSTPDNQRLIEAVGLIAFNNDSRSRMNAAPTEDVAGDDIGFLGSSKTTTFLEYNSSAPLSPTTRKINIVWHNPGHVKILQAVLNEGPGNQGDGKFLSGVLALPYFWNLVGVNLSNNGNSTVDFTNVTSITGNWSRRLKSISVGSNLSTSRALTSIANKFPVTLERLMLMSTISNVNTLVADCVNLKTIWMMALVTPHSYSETFPSVVGSVTNGFQDTTFTIAHVTHLEFLGIMNSALTSLTMPSVNNNTLKKLGLITTGISNAEFLSALNYALSSSALLFLNIRNLNKTVSKTIGDSDLNTIIEQFYTYGNIITGDITLTSARASCTAFKIGITTTSITVAANKNNHANVNVTAFTVVVTLDLSNGRTSDLQLPVNTVIQNLHLGGNKLDVTVNTSLVSQIQAMTNLRKLHFSAGVSSVNPLVPTALNVNIENGQNSVGFGANLDLSALTLLQEFIAHNCGSSGDITLPSSIILFGIHTNSVDGISGAGSFSNITYFVVSSNLNFDFDFTRLPSVSLIHAGNCDLTVVDLSSRTAVTQWTGVTQGPFYLPNNVNLTVITFPTTQARSLINSASGAGNDINISGCTSLATVTNIENLNYTPIANGNIRRFYANGCSLNTDLKVGVSDFIPTDVKMENNAMSVANVNLNIDNVYQGRRKWDTFTNVKSLNIAGTNAAPSGTFVAPTGYKSATITGISKAKPGIITFSAIGALVNNEVIRIRSVLGMIEVNDKYYMIKNISGSTAELWSEDGSTQINTTGFTTYVSGGTAYVEGSAPANAKEQLYILVNAFGWTMTYN